MERWYTSKIYAAEAKDVASFMANKTATSARIDTLEKLFSGQDKQSLRIAEFGVWEGGTSSHFCKFLDNKGELHLFDFEEQAACVKTILESNGYNNVFAWGCSYKHLDSYNWSLKHILETRPDIRFDYVYLDGAHTWSIDALAFFLCDMLLNVGGFIEFDDYDWTLRGSSLDPAKIPVIGTQYTDEQIDAKQVKSIVDLIVKRKPNYHEIIRNRLFRKWSVSS